jgi:Holliday junction resolvase-like predicted endonuclease
MISRPCKCGAIPQITERTVSMLQVVEVKCACGESGKAAVSYIKPQDRARSMQAAADGWNLG